MQSPYAQPECEYSWTYEKSSGTSDFIHAETEYKYDEFGNCIEIKQNFGDGEILLGKVIYDNTNTTDYIVGLPVDIRVYDSKGSLLRHRSGDYDEYGQLKELRQYFDVYNYSSNFLSYDNFGNIKSVSDSRGATLAYTYDTAENIFVTEILQGGKNTDTYKSKIDYDIATQTKTKETDCNGNTLRYEYDGWQRLTKIWTAYDGATPAVSYEYFTPQKNADSFCDLWYAITGNKVTFDSDDDSVIQTVLQIDGLGRAVRTAKTGFVNGVDGWNASGAVEYDSKGRTVKAGMTEFIEGSLESLLSSRPKMTDLFSSYKYDEKDRQVRTILPDGSVQENRFYIEENKLISESIDPLGNVSLQETDSRGNVIRVAKFDKDGAQLTEVTYRYNELGEMLNAFDAKENPISVEYDLLGRRTALESLDSGRQEFFYDECSNLVRENNSVLKENNKQIVYEYDGLNRLVRIDYPDTEDTVYTYGGASNTHGAAGKIRSITDASGTLEYEYGALGEVTKETRTLATHLNRNNPTETAVMEYRSDYLGRMQWIVYPDGEKITYGYDRGGQVVSVTGEHYGHEFKYVTDILYDEYGQRTRIDYGNGTFTEYTYDPARRWLDTIKTQNKWGQNYQNISYSFDAVGNVLGYENDCLDTVTGNYKTKQTYSYDNLYQLIKVDGETVYNPYISSVPEFVSNYSQVFSFDSDGLGNMTSKVSKETVTPQKSIGDNLNYNFDYVYDENFAHRLVRAGDRYYKYDANGNITVEQDGSFESNGDDVSYHKITQEAEDVYSTDYGWGLFREENGSSGGAKGSKYRRTYVWNEKNLLISSVDANYNTAYVYGQDGQRSNKYTANSETLYFNKMWTLHTESYNQKLWMS
ncbi:RHS repeat domain-containing protein [Treponema sp.]|uniref:RHS repeat domain-containing protein n=1 Tax=Treponema sp. TaxID=166 RepID=UPI003F1235EE